MKTFLCAAATCSLFSLVAGCGGGSGSGAVDADLTVIDADPGAIDASSMSDALPTPPLFSEVVAGRYFSCARTGTTVLCWGAITLGSLTPPAGVQFKQITAGDDHVCGIDIDDNVVCWGDNTNGQSTPPAGNFASVEAGADATCAVGPQGNVTCWGNPNLTTPPAGALSRLTGGALHFCGIDATWGNRCWGRNLEGQSAELPGPFGQIGAGELHTCMLANFGNGVITCQGQNLSGAATPPSGDYDNMEIGPYWGCARDRVDRTLTCWGADAEGQVSNVPTVRVLDFAVGGFHGCAILPDTSIICWGNNGDGQATPPS